MIWQEKVPSVVMITNLVEGKKTKCEQYWPTSGSEAFGPFQVTITKQLILADYTIRTLSVEVYRELSQRGDSPFVYRDCTGLPASLPYIRKIHVSVAISTQSGICLQKRVPMVKI